MSNPGNPSKGAQTHERTGRAVIAAVVSLIVYLLLFRVLLNQLTGMYAKVDASTAGTIRALVVLVFGTSILASLASALTIERFFPRADRRKIFGAITTVLIIFGVLSIGVDLPRHNDPTVVLVIHPSVTLIAIYVVKIYLNRRGAV